MNKNTAKCRITVSKEQEKYINAMLDSTSSLPREVIEDTRAVVFETLQNNHPLNRLIPYPNSHEGAVRILLACVDIDNKKNKNAAKNEKHVYIRYMLSDSELRSALTTGGEEGADPKPSLDLLEEFTKLVSKAQKLGYTTLSFDGRNPILNRRAEDNGWKDAGPSSFSSTATHYTYDLTNSTANPKLKKIERTKKEKIRYLQVQAPSLMASIESNTSMREQFDQALTDRMQSKGYDSEIWSSLYGYLDTVSSNDQSFLTNTYSIPKLIEQAKSITSTRNTIRQNEYFSGLISEYLCTELSITTLHDRIEPALTNIFLRKEKNRAKSLSKIFATVGVSIPESLHSTSTANDRRLRISSLDTHATPEHICNVLINEEQWSIVSLKTMSHLQEETNALGHCIGKSDFYIKKIQNGSMYALSLRDSTGTPKYTLEYDIVTKSINQFKGGGDEPVNSLPNSEEIVTQTFSALYDAYIPVDRYNEKFNYSLMRTYNKISNTVSAQYTALDIENLTQKVLSGDEILDVIKGEIKVPANISWPQLERISQMPGLESNLTSVPQYLKDRVTTRKGCIIDTGNSVIYKNLQSIEGNFDVRNAKKFSILTLQSVGGYIDASSAKSFSVPNLQSVGGYIRANNTRTFLAPNLQSVGGYIVTSSANRISIQSLTKCRKIVIGQDNAQLIDDIPQAIRYKVPILLGSGNL